MIIQLLQNRMTVDVGWIITDQMKTLEFMQTNSNSQSL